MMQNSRNYDELVSDRAGSKFLTLDGIAYYHGPILTRNDAQLFLMLCLRQCLGNTTRRLFMANVFRLFTPCVSAAESVKLR